MGRAGSSLQLVHGLLLIALVMRLASPDTANYSYLILAGCALAGGERVVQALALAWLFTALSGGVGPPLLTSEAAVGRYAVVAAAVISVFLRSRQAKEWFSMSRPVRATLALGAFLIIHSMLFSALPEISIFRALLWTIVMATLLSAWLGLDFEARARVERQLFVGLVLLVLVSLPLAFTDIGYLRNGTGFQGVLSHPQAFGPVVAMLAAWVAGRLLSTAGPRWSDVAFLGLCFVLVVMSESRTAGFALILGLASAVLVLPLIAGIPARRLMPGLASRRLHALGLIAVIGVMVVGPALSGRVGDYAQKRTDSAGLFEAMVSSRGLLVQTMIANFEEEPLTGIGFGIASGPSFIVVVREPMLGLPISASIEKGVLPIAVLEEIGIFGFLLVVAWLWLMVKRSARAGIAAFAVVAVVLLLNLGESTLFSPGGLGLLQLILLAWAFTGGHHPVPDRTRG